MPSKRNGVIGTILIHGLALILLLVYGFAVPVIPTGDQGILINFGTSRTGLGDIEPAMAEPQQNEEEAESSPAKQEEADEAEKSIMTQNFEEAPAVKKTEQKKKKEPDKKVISETSKTETTTSKKEEVKPTVNTKALYTGKNTGTTQSGSQGITEPGGNQGGPNGSIESDSYIGNGLGTTGIGYDLAGRGGVHLEAPPPDFERGGVVVVEILVDREGNVISAREGIKGSTTTDIRLLKLAREAALKSKFSAKSDAAVHQKGTITYTFKLK